MWANIFSWWPQVTESAEVAREKQKAKDAELLKKFTDHERNQEFIDKKYPLKIKVALEDAIKQWIVSNESPRKQDWSDEKSTDHSEVWRIRGKVLNKYKKNPDWFDLQEALKSVILWEDIWWMWKNPISLKSAWDPSTLSQADFLNNSKNKAQELWNSVEQYFNEIDAGAKVLNTYTAHQQDTPSPYWETLVKKATNLDISADWEVYDDKLKTVEASEAELQTRGELASEAFITDNWEIPNPAVPGALGDVWVLNIQQNQPEKGIPEHEEAKGNIEDPLGEYQEAAQPAMTELPDAKADTPLPPTERIPDAATGVAEAMTSTIDASWNILSWEFLRDASLVIWKAPSVKQSEDTLRTPQAPAVKREVKKDVEPLSEKSKVWRVDTAANKILSRFKVAPNTKASSKITEKLKNTNEREKNVKQWLSLFFNNKWQVSSYAWNDQKLKDLWSRVPPEWQSDEDLNKILWNFLTITEKQSLSGVNQIEQIDVVQGLNDAFELQSAKLLDGKTNYPAKKVESLQNQMLSNETNPLQKLALFKEIKGLVNTEIWAKVKLSQMNNKQLKEKRTELAKKYNKLRKKVVAENKDPRTHAELQKLRKSHDLYKEEIEKRSEIMWWKVEKEAIWGDSWATSNWASPKASK